MIAYGVITRFPIWQLLGHRAAKRTSFNADKTTEDVLKSNMIDAGSPASINLHQRKCTVRMSWQICDRSIFSLRPLSDTALHCMKWMSFDPYGWFHPAKGQPGSWNTVGLHRHCMSGSTCTRALMPNSVRISADCSTALWCCSSFPFRVPTGWSLPIGPISKNDFPYWCLW